MAEWDPKKDAYFAGLTDGEGCFTVAFVGQERLAPRFQIKLRSDDSEILEQLAAAFGGVIKTYPAAGGYPQATWLVLDKAGLAGLVDYFDRFTLRAKKRRDYEIWRTAVLAYCAHGSSYPRLVDLRDALVEVRKPGTDLDLPEIAPSPQMELVSTTTARS